MFYCEVLLIRIWWDQNRSVWANVRTKEYVPTWRKNTPRRTSTINNEAQVGSRRNCHTSCFFYLLSWNILYVLLNSFGKKSTLALRRFRKKNLHNFWKMLIFFPIIYFFKNFDCQVGIRRKCYIELKFCIRFIEAILPKIRISHKQIFQKKFFFSLVTF